MTLVCWRSLATKTPTNHNRQTSINLVSLCFRAKPSAKVTGSFACTTDIYRQQPMQSSSLRLQQLKHEAEQAAESGDFSAATALFDAALQLCPADAVLHEQQAQCLMELEDFTAALHAADKATSLRPDWPDAWSTLARCYLNNGQLQSAHLAFSKSLALDPGQLEVLSELAEVQQLAQQEISRRVGLPGLKISEDPVGQLGPGCVIWEAGLTLAHMLVSTNNSRKQQQQHCSGVAASALQLHTNNRVGSDSGSLQHAHGLHTIAASASLDPDKSHSPSNISVAADAACCRQSVCPAWQVAGAHILEAGAGTGVVGITAAALGAHVTLTDLPVIQPLLRSNIAANQQLIDSAGGSATAAELDWIDVASHAGPTISSNSSMSDGGGGAAASAAVSAVHRQQQHRVPYDWAMGADLVYNKQQIVPVVDMIAGLLSVGSSTKQHIHHAAHNGSQTHCSPTQTHHEAKQENAAQAVGEQPAVPQGFLLAHKHRHDDVDQELMESVRAAGLCVQQVAPDRQPGGYDSITARQQLQQQQQQVSVWWLTTQQHRSHTQKQATAKQIIEASNGDQHVREQVCNQQQQQQKAGEQQRLQEIDDVEATLQQLQLKQPPKQARRLLLLSAGLAGVGKSTVLKLLCSRLGSNSMYVDKDTINQALLQGNPYFSDYYKQHVQQQTYAVMFSIAADNLTIRENCTMILDGQFGDKLSACYVMPCWRAIQRGQGVNQVSESSACTQNEQVQKNIVVSDVSSVDQRKCSVVLLVCECDTQLQLERLQAKGLDRDEGKYADFEAYRVRELLSFQQQLQQVGSLLDGIVRVDTSQPPDVCVQQIMATLFD